MKIPNGTNNGLTRRVFINRSLTATGGVMIMSQAHSWPVLAGERVTGDVSKMGRIVFDESRGQAWTSLLDVTVTTSEIETEWGPTKAIDARDRILVGNLGLTGFSNEVDITKGQSDAKMDPRIAVAGGRVCVTWCAMNQDNKKWHIYAAITDDGKTWTEPMRVSGGEGLSLHPDVAIDPETGTVWIAYEDWGDGSIRLTSYDGKWSKPVKLSESGKNYRPCLLVTRKSGPHRGKVAVGWDSYRDGQYDIYLWLSGGSEIRVTDSRQWDSTVDMAEDLDGNIWLAWVRAMTDLCNYDTMRVVHARFFDGERFYWPNSPSYIDASDNGRINGYESNMFPKLRVDKHNRVHLFYRNTVGGLFGFLFVKTYEGDHWTEPRKIRDKRLEDALSIIWDYSVTLDDKNRALPIWDSLYVKRLGFASDVHPCMPLRLGLPARSRYTTVGFEGPDSDSPGWPRRDAPERSVMEFDGGKYTLLYGDTHSHSWTSDGIDPADWYYHFARDVVGLDYYALSDHDFTISNTPGLEAYLSFLPKQFNSPDFVCFQAYEFSSQKTGHRVVVFEGDDNQTFPLTYPPANKSNLNQELYPFLRKFAYSPDSRVLVTAHNMSQMGNSFMGHDPQLEPLYDVTSLWVVAEKPWSDYAEEMQESNIWATLGPIMRIGSTGEEKRLWNMCWRDCLDDGMFLGAYGTSDTHAANGLGYVVSGLWVLENSRKAIFDAMYAKRSIAIDSGIRLYHAGNIDPASKIKNKPDQMLRADVRLFGNGNLMGKEISASSAPRFQVVANNIGDDDHIRSAFIIRDGKEVHSEFGNGTSMVLKWKDTQAVSGRHYYYARIEFKSGRVAFSSPIFINIS